MTPGSMTPGSTTKNNNRNKTQKTSYLIISSYPKIDVYLILAMLKLIAHPKPAQLPQVDSHHGDDGDDGDEGDET